MYTVLTAAVHWMTSVLAAAVRALDDECTYTVAAVHWMMIVLTAAVH